MRRSCSRAGRRSPRRRAHQLRQLREPAAALPHRAGKGRQVPRYRRAGRSPLRPTLGIVGRGKLGAASSQPRHRARQRPTGTNLQEQDVDEPDRAKLRDGRIVLLAQAGSRRHGDRHAPGVSILPLGRAGVGRRAAARRRPRRWSCSRPAGPAPASPGPADSRTIARCPRTPTTRLRAGRPRRPGAAAAARGARSYDGRTVSARLTDGTVRLVTTSQPQPPGVPTRTPPARPRRPRRWPPTRPRRTPSRWTRCCPRCARRDGAGRTLEQGTAVDCGQDVPRRQRAPARAPCSSPPCDPGRARGRPTAPPSRPTATSSTPPPTACTSPPAAGAPPARCRSTTPPGAGCAPGRRAGEHRAARVRHERGPAHALRRHRLRARLRHGPLGAVGARGRAARRHHPAAAVGGEQGRDVLEAVRAGRAGRRAGRDRAGSTGSARTEQHPRGALLRRHRRGRDVPPDRPAVPGRPVGRPPGSLAS